MAISTFLRYEAPLGGVCVLSGLNCDMDFDYDELNIKEKNKTPLWIYHGEEDEFVSEENAKMSYDQIKSVGVDFE